MQREPRVGAGGSGPRCGGPSLFTSSRPRGTGPGHLSPCMCEWGEGRALDAGPAPTRTPSSSAAPPGPSLLHPRLLHAGAGDWEAEFQGDHKRISGA